VREQEQARVLEPVRAPVQVRELEQVLAVVVPAAAEAAALPVPKPSQKSSSSLHAIAAGIVFQSR
jgi:hypothetical protein